IDPQGTNPQLIPADFGLPEKTSRDSIVNALAEDREGAIWAGMLNGTLYRRLSDGRVEHYTSANGLPATVEGLPSEIQDLLIDQRDRHWVATIHGLFRLASNPHPGATIVDYHPSLREGFPDKRVYCLFESSSGDVWAGMFLYLAEFPH